MIRMTMLGARVVVTATTVPGQKGPVDLKVLQVVDPKSNWIVEVPLVAEAADELRKDLEGGKVEVAREMPKASWPDEMKPEK